MRRVERLVCVAFLAAVTAAGGSCRREKQVSPQPAEPVRPPYAQTLADIDSWRRETMGHYLAARDEQARGRVLAGAREEFVRRVARELFPYWYGTAWDFYGTTQTPGQGRIACGYFVTTVLRDAGLRVERAALAQQASEWIIKSLVEEPHIRRFRGVALAEFVTAVAAMGPGLYVVGLDRHVGFILHDAGGTRFVHSSPYGAGTVVNEPAGTSRTLTESKYRVIGRISASDDLMLKWLQGTAIPTRTR